jgi:hypothetical protein
MTGLNIEDFYLTEIRPTNDGLKSWQHMCGLFQWHISVQNVSLCCPKMDLDKIAWPEKGINPGSEGV